MTLQVILRKLFSEEVRVDKPNPIDLLKQRARSLEVVADALEQGDSAAENPMLSFFEARQTGRGIWKWKHYFEPYLRHLHKFHGQSPVLLEIGVYSGGSLEMWRDYFGPEAELFGVDIVPECKKYAAPRTNILIGDQADRSFWKEVRGKIPRPDIIIDDGGHEANQQAVTFEETISWIKPGGVYICEDVHGESNEFTAYVCELIQRLNAFDFHESSPGVTPQSISSSATALQKAIRSIHIYPFMVVIEKHGSPLGEFEAPKHGTEWEPFL
jgi:hypothetical protein